jgi:hypothetical protein
MKPETGPAPPDLDETSLEAALIEFSIATREGVPLRRALREAILAYLDLAPRQAP